MRYRCIALLLVACAGLALHSAQAGDDKPAADRPGADRPAIAVVGDSLADGMWTGLYRVVGKSKVYSVYRGAKNSVGFSGGGLTEMIDRAFAAGKMHALVMMIGANDRKTIFAEDKAPAQFRSPEWRAIYAERAAHFMDYAGKQSVPLIWILLPVMRTEEANQDAQMINAIITEAARSRPHVTLIETATLTADEQGAYTAYFPDLNGQRRLMRSGDGIHFEPLGYELIATLVLKRLRELSPRFAKAGE